MPTFYSHYDLNYVPYQPVEAGELTHWLVSDTWPYHPHIHLDHDTVQHWIETGLFDAANSRTFWVLVEGWQKVGLIRLFELQAEAPLFDLRLWTPFRNRLIGRAALAWLTNYIFDTCGKASVECVTRTDNLPMRRILRHCGYHKGGYHRQSWPDDFGCYAAVVGYGVSRMAWAASG